MRIPRLTRAGIGAADPEMLPYALRSRLATWSRGAMAPITAHQFNVRIVSFAGARANSCDGGNARHGGRGGVDSLSIGHAAMLRQRIGGKPITGPSSSMTIAPGVGAPIAGRSVGKIGREAPGLWTQIADLRRSSARPAPIHFPGNTSLSTHYFGSVTQLDRVSDFYSDCCRFDSYRARHMILGMAA